MDKAGDEDCNKEDDCNDDDCNDNNDDDEDDEDKDKKAGEGVPVVLDVTARTAKRTKMTTKAKTSLGTRKLGSEDRKAGEAGEGRAEGNDTDDGDFAGLLESGVAGAKRGGGLAHEPSDSEGGAPPLLSCSARQSGRGAGLCGAARGGGCGREERGGGGRGGGRGGKGQGGGRRGGRRGGGQGEARLGSRGGDERGGGHGVAPGPAAPFPPRRHSRRGVGGACGEGTPAQVLCGRMHDKKLQKLHKAQVKSVLMTVFMFQIRNHVTRTMFR
mmetsp:Transcript_24782/g.54117  ORF Transcript_24782/g.54117 Transcript_24782/m.54117 type:complete len:271 (+) Transcript_24782:1038-1850(+)